MGIKTNCGCYLPGGRWLSAICEHGREFILPEVELVEITERPKVVCLCGATKFYAAFQRASFNETMRGNIVLSVGIHSLPPDETGGEGVEITPRERDALDRLNFRKIDLADEILVLNVGGHIDQETEKQIAYADATGKKIRFLEGAKICALNLTSG